jgi:4-amino-4-deoxy-L-arabinose transferase-like glycosyltransferase
MGQRPTEPCIARKPAGPWYSRFSVGFAVVFLLGLGLRAYGLNRESVSHDESFSMTACQMPTAGMLRLLVADFVHPPLHYLALCGWMGATGYGVLQARLLALVFGTLSIAVLYLLADYLFDRRTALVASLLLAISQLAVMQSQDARMYAQFLFLFLTCSYLLARAMYERSRRFWWAFVGVAILLLYTHYFAVLALGAMLLFGLLFRRRFSVPLSWWAAGAAVVILAFVPWLTSGVVQAAVGSAKTFSGTNPWWSVDTTTFFAAFNFFNNGKPAGLLATSPLWTFPAGGLLFGLPLVLGFFRIQNARENQNVWLAAMLAVLPVLGAIVGGYMRLQYDHRYVAFCAAPYYVLVGRGVAAIRHHVRRTVLIVLLVLYSGNALRANYSIPRREDFRGAAQYLQGHVQPGDCGVFIPGYKIPSQWSIEQPTPNLFRVLTLEEFTEQRTSCNRIWAITWSYNGNRGQLATIKIELQRLETTHTLVDEHHYVWVDAGLYVKKTP